jgi:SAM-dependent methyltransferase
MPERDGTQAHGPQADRWMQRWLPAMREAAGGTPLLELGCDDGGDTAWLLAQGFAVVATDIAPDALARCARNAPAAQLLQHDLRTPLPFADGRFGVVVASLCLHYFDWRTTKDIANGLHRVLRPGGLLLCRVNSTRDVLHGAGQGERLERNYYRLDARYASFKRFFDEDELRALFAAPAWHTLSCEERSIHRYAEPKVAWEVVLRRS